MGKFVGLFLIFGLSTLASWAITSWIGRKALQWGVIARRDARRRHERDTPLLGGTAFYLILTTILGLAWLAPGVLGLQAVSPRFALCFWAAISLVYGIGAIDDCIELKAPPKFTVQVIAATLILLARPELPPVLRTLDVPQWLSAPMLVLWIVGLTNAMNMIDGLDGLCAGVAGLTSLTLTLIMVSFGATQAAGGGFPMVITVAVAGSCLGFLFLNFNPARIFLGDSGSLLLGFLLAVVAIELEVKRSLFVSLGMPIFLLGLPLLDIGLSVVRRQRQKRSLFTGDRSHLHHRLQQLGMGQRGAVVLLWCASLYMNSVAFLLAQVPASQSGFIYAMVLPTLAFWLFALYFVEKRISFQSAQFSQLFLQHEESLFAGRDAVIAFTRAQVARQRSQAIPFTVLVMDSADLLKQMAHERPARIIEYYLKLYAILRNRLRRTDMIARISDFCMVAVLEGSPQPGSNDWTVVDFLNDQVRGLQESYHLFQSHTVQAEGFQVLRFPRDEKRIWQALGVHPAELRVQAASSGEPGAGPAEAVG